MLMAGGSADRYLTVEQVASQLQMHPDTIRDFLRREVLPGKKVGRIWRVSQAALDRYIEGEDENGIDAENDQKQ